MIQLLGEGHTAALITLCVFTDCEGKVTNSSELHDIDKGTMGRDMTSSYYPFAQLEVCNLVPLIRVIQVH